MYSFPRKICRDNTERAFRMRLTFALGERSIKCGLRILNRTRIVTVQDDPKLIIFKAFIPASHFAGTDFAIHLQPDPAFLNPVRYGRDIEPSPPGLSIYRICANQDPGCPGSPNSPLKKSIRAAAGPCGRMTRPRLQSDFSNGLQNNSHISPRLSPELMARTLPGSISPSRYSTSEFSLMRDLAGANSGPYTGILNRLRNHATSLSWFGLVQTKA